MKILRLFKRYVVILDCFSHDGSGNPIASHTVIGINNLDDTDRQNGPLLYRTRQRRQIGYTNKRDEWAETALSHAGAPDGLTLAHVEGDRSNGQMFLVYDFPALPEAPQPSTFTLYGRRFKTYAFTTDDAANAFMTAFPSWGLIGIDDQTNLRHVAHKSDKGK